VASTFIPILVLMGFAALVAAALLILSALLGRQVRTRRKLSTYECGMPLLDASRKRISVKYSVVAMVFILFDVEIAFLYPWTVIFRSYGWGMFLEMVLFLATLAVGYAYIWKKGALDW
jgi:NADH:ubiquinone oxidoreductase subunit 3 (subunit A)